MPTTTPIASAINTSAADKAHADSYRASPMPAMFATMTEFAAKSAGSTSRLWSELLQSQVGFMTRVFDAMPFSRANASRTEATIAPPKATPSGVKTPRPVVDDVRSAHDEFPIKRYDTLTVQEITSRIGRLRDANQVQLVLTYENRNKKRKGVVAAGKLQLSRLADR